MKKIILLLAMLGHILFANNCIGYTYESKIVEMAKVPTVKIISPKSLPISGIVNLSADATMDIAATPYYRWCTNIGTLQSNDNNFKNVKWILPIGWEGKKYKAKIYLLAGDSLGSEAYMKKEFKGTVDLEQTRSSTQLNVQYIQSEDKFRVSWNSQNTDYVEVLYSWDNITFKRFAMLSVKNQAIGSYAEQINGSKSHNRIYMKPISIKGLKQVKGGVDVWEYIVKSDGKEPPAKAILKSLKDKTIHDYVDVVWYEVRDSKGNKNVDKYQLSYADNSRFSNDTVIDITSGRSKRVIGLTDDKRYYFRVRAINNKGRGDWSSKESIRVDIQDIPTIVNTTQTPSHSTIGVSKTPTFRWNASDKDGDKLEYFVSIGEKRDNLNIKSGWLEGRQRFNYSDEFSRPLKPNTTYYWQVTFREAHHYLDYYGGEYPKSEIWSFTTVGTGPDISVTNIHMIGDIKIDEWISFEVTVKNNGTEVANEEDVIPYFVKDGQENEFAAYKRGNMQRELKPGEEEKIVVKVQFSNKIETKTFTKFNLEGTEYKKTKNYDNILVDGANILRFKIDYSPFDIDTNRANDKKDTTVNYSLADNLPVIDYDKLTQNNLSRDRGDYRYMLGWKVSYTIRAEDQIKINKYIMEYRTSKNDEWHHIQTYTNDTDKIREKIEWVIPQSNEFVTQTMQLRVKVYNPSGKYSSVVSPEFKVFENEISVDELYVDKSNYKLGKPIIITYSTSSKYAIKDFRIYIRQDKASEKLFTFDFSQNSSFDGANSLQFTIPNESNLIGTDAYVEVYMKDENGAYTRKESVKFTIEQNTEVPKVFTPYKDVFTEQYNNFPSDTLRHSTENYVQKAILDDNGLVHMIVFHKGEWWTSDRHGNIDELKDHITFYYMTYNPISKETSTPKKMFESRRIDSGHLDDEMYRDFIMNGDTPILLTVNYKTHTATKYQLNGSSVSTSTLVTGSEFDSYSLVNYKGKTYLTYRYLTDTVEDRRAKAKEIYPNMGGDFNIVDEYYGSSFRINGDILSFYYKGITFRLDSNMQVMESTKHKVYNSDDSLKSTLRGDIKIYDSNIKEMYIDDSANLFLLKSDNSKETLIHLDDSEIAEDGRGRQKIEASIYPDRVIVVYRPEYSEDSSRKQYRVVIYSRETKTIEFINIGNKIYGFGEVYTNVDINNKKQIVIVNPDGKYDTYAQLITADLKDGFGIEAPAIHIDTQDNTIELNKELTINWSMAKESDKLDYFEVYKVVNGTSTLLKTINNTLIQTYTYRQTNTNENIVSLKVMAVTNEGDRSSDQMTLRVIKPVEIISFTVDKNTIDLGESLKFYWEITGGNNNLYKGYKKCSDDTYWSKIFETRTETKIYTINSFTGVCQFKITSGESEKALTDAVQIDGQIYAFKVNSFAPKGEYELNRGIINFKWNTTFDENIEFKLFIKKLGASNFEEIASTIKREYSYNYDVGSTFKWKVSFNDGVKEVISPIMDVNVKQIIKPTIISNNFLFENNQPKIVLKMSSLPTSITYEIYRSQYANNFRKIGESQTTNYTDRSISYGITYSYYVVALKGDIRSIESDTILVDALNDDTYNVIMETDNYQVALDRKMTIDYKPSKSVNFEQYEIRIGTDINHIYFYTLTKNRSITIEDLDYNKNYFIEVYPVSYLGKQISSLPAKLTFSTEFDQRTINSKAQISIDEVAVDNVSLSWSKVENANLYTICRSEDNADIECLESTNSLNYIDSINILKGSTYKYIIKATNNGLSFSVSNESIEITPNPLNNDLDNDGIEDKYDHDIDGDGVLNLNDAFPLDSTETLDTDGDGIGNNTDTDDDGDGIDDDTEINLGLNPLDASDSDDVIDCREIGLLNHQGETFVRVSKCIDPSNGDLYAEPLLEDAQCNDINLRLIQGSIDCYQEDIEKKSLKLLP